MFQRTIPFLLLFAFHAQLVADTPKHKHHKVVPTTGTSATAENPPPKGFGEIDHLIEIETLRGRMKYDLERFSVPPNAKVKLVLRNKDDMPHNLVLCKPDVPNVGMEIAKKAWALGGDAIAKHYTPEHPSILFHTTLVAPRSAQAFYFKAPTKTGSYPYVCTLPGHAFYMKGVMTVAQLIKTPSGKAAGLSEITYKVYEGKWDRLPDFEKLEPAANGQMGNALISPNVAKSVSDFGIVFEGVIAVPNKGRYSFELGSADGSRLEIKEQSIIDNDGRHGHQARTGGINLDPGDHPFRLLYFKRGSKESLTLRWRGPGISTAWLTKPPSGKSGPSLPILPEVEGETVMYRNFVSGAGTRGIAVGYPQGVNLAFDANQVRLALLWQGAFMDGGRHWTGRGQGFQGPAGYAKISLPESPPFAFLEKADDTWPKPEDGRSPGYRFLGYERDKTRRPAFLYEFPGVKVRDFPKGGVELAPYLIREFTLEGRIGDRNLFYLAAAGNKIDQKEASYVVDGKYAVSFPDHKGLEPILRDSAGRKELLLQVNLDGEQSFVQRYDWNYE